MEKYQGMRRPAASQRVARQAALRARQGLLAERQVAQPADAQRAKPELRVAR
jgi:hypothetical protein